MAKRVPKLRFGIEADLVAGTYTIYFLSHEDPDDDADADRLYKRNDAAYATSFPKVIMGGELADTLQACIDMCVTEVETHEGI